MIAKAFALYVAKTPPKRTARREVRRPNERPVRRG